jgi:hypothetical protein
MAHSLGFEIENAFTHEKFHLRAFFCAYSMDSPAEKSLFTNGGANAKSGDLMRNTEGEVKGKVVKFTYAEAKKSRLYTEDDVCFFLSVISFSIDPRVSLLVEEGVGGNSKWY